MSKNRLTIRYPWSETPIGGSFFVPAFDTKRVISEGLRASIGTGTVPDTPRIGAVDGKFGVLFKRRK